MFLFKQPCFRHGLPIAHHWDFWSRFFTGWMSFRCATNSIIAVKGRYSEFWMLVSCGTCAELGGSSTASCWWVTTDWLVVGTSSAEGAGDDPRQGTLGLCAWWNAVASCGLRSGTPLEDGCCKKGKTFDVRWRCNYFLLLFVLISAKSMQQITVC